MPAYTTAVTHATGDVFPATDWNTYIRDNLAFLHDQGADLASAATITPTNQFHRITGTTTITAIAAPSGSGQGGNRLLLKFQSAGCAITAGAALILTNGAFTSAANGMIHFVWDSTAAAWIETGRTFGQGAYTVKTTSKTVNNSVAETDLLNGEITLAANALGANGLARLIAWGDCLQNTGANQDSNRWKLAIGGTVILDTDAVPINTQKIWQPATLRTGWRIVAEIQNLGATNAQVVSLNVDHALFTNANNQIGFATGNGRHWNTPPAGERAVGDVAAAIDTTAAKLLELKVIQPLASASMETKLIAAILELER